VTRAEICELWLKYDNNLNATRKTCLTDIFPPQFYMDKHVIEAGFPESDTALILHDIYIVFTSV
jgi:hypothetical protein